jgi:hypothetical protein
MYALNAHLENANATRQHFVLFSGGVEDAGARLYVRSSFSVLIRTTGVPKYRIAGSLAICIVSTAKFALSGA